MNACADESETTKADKDLYFEMSVGELYARKYCLYADHHHSKGEKLISSFKIKAPSKKILAEYQKLQERWDRERLERSRALWDQVFASAATLYGTEKAKP